VDTPLPENAKRFDDALQARMRELKKSYAQVAREAGITVTALTAWRKGRNRPSARLAAALDSVLWWRQDPSSTLSLFDGGDAVPLAIGGTPDPDELRIKAMRYISDEKKEQLIQQLRAAKSAVIEGAEALDKLGETLGQIDDAEDQARNRSA
jgi:transcriptional regulator with XRE-family HTH domain